MTAHGVVSVSTLHAGEWLVDLAAPITRDEIRTVCDVLGVPWKSATRIEITPANVTVHVLTATSTVVTVSMRIEASS